MWDLKRKIKNTKVLVLKRTDSAMERDKGGLGGGRLSSCLCLGLLGPWAPLDPHCFIIEDT